MISDLSLLQAVQQTLRTQFDLPVYLQEVKEDFSVPAFFLKTMTVATPVREGQLLRDTDMYITYIPKKRESSTAIYAVLFAVEGLFCRGVTVGNRHVSVESITEELIGEDADGGRVTLTVRYYDALPEVDEGTAAERMQVLHQRYQGKETVIDENAIH